ncbi:replication-associated protein [Capybara virus 23_cap1_803]|nr:replication-associated protein [Capybara virus 23_cap1_803]
MFQGTSFLITYPPRCLRPRLRLGTPPFAFFGSLGQLKYLRIGVEQHESGDPHWHAVAYYAVKLRLAARGFDFRDKHPNVQTVGRKVIDWQRVVAYVAKDGRYREHGSQRHSSESVWAEAAAADDRETAERLIAAAAPRDWIVHRRSIDYSMEAMFPVPPRSSFQPRDPTSFRIPAELVQWLSESPSVCLNRFFLWSFRAPAPEASASPSVNTPPFAIRCPRPERPRSLVLMSGSRFGKTQWARALGNHVYIANMWDLGAFDGIGDEFWHNGYVVFDDISWDSIKGSAKSWFGAQSDFTVSDKYRRKRRMPGGIPCIFLLNPDAYVSDCFNFLNGDWAKENMTLVILRNKLY